MKTLLLIDGESQGKELLEEHFKDSDDIMIAVKNGVRVFGYKEDIEKLLDVSTIADSVTTYRKTEL